MALNPLFNNWSDVTEQDMYENMVIESIQMYGLDLNYIPREYGNLDGIWNEDALSKFEDIYKVEAYITDIQGYEGEGTFMSFFGIQNRDQINFSIAKKRFKEVLAGVRERPMEGDIVWLPQFDNRLFRILSVNRSKEFYQLGKYYTWDFTCEVFENSSEVFDTQDLDLNDIVDSFSMDEAITGDPYEIPNDASAANEDLEEKGDGLKNHSIKSPFGNF